MALAAVAASLVFAFSPPPIDRPSDEELLAAALFFVALGVLLGLVPRFGAMRRSVARSGDPVVLAFSCIGSYGY